MGMTIDDATLYMELYKRKLFNSVSALDKDIEAYDLAIDTMRKYQKIDWITEAWDDDENAMILVHKIREVIEDGQNIIKD